MCVNGTVNIVMDESTMEVPSESLMVYKTSLFLTATRHSTDLDVHLLQHLKTGIQIVLYSPMLLCKTVGESVD